jgi:hypothetical protein
MVVTNSGTGLSALMAQPHEHLLPLQACDCTLGRGNTLFRHHWMPAERHALGVTWSHP